MADLLTLYAENPVTMGAMTVAAGIIVTVAFRLVLK